jgi:hypothetical protein
MGRTVWIGLVCLITICGLTAYKIGFAAPAKNQAASADPSAVIANADYASTTKVAEATSDAAASKDDVASTEVAATKDAPATKTDRLDVDYLQDVPDKTLVHTIPIVLSDPAAKAEPEKASPPEKGTRIASRHWRSSYARLSHRHIRHQREVTHSTNEVKASHIGLLGWLRPAAK